LAAKDWRLSEKKNFFFSIFGQWFSGDRGFDLFIYVYEPSRPRCCGEFSPNLVTRHVYICMYRFGSCRKAVFESPLESWSQGRVSLRGLSSPHCPNIQPRGKVLFRHLK
jgi:hypothetical protein